MKATRKRPDGKPYPRPDFPLTAHPSGRWCKKVRVGNEWKLRYFGRWYKKVKVNGEWQKVYLGDDEAKSALERYKNQKDDLYLGRDPEKKGETVRDLLNAFLASKKTRVETGELAQCTFDDYKATCDQIAECFGKMRQLSNLTKADFANLRGFLARGKKHKITGKRKKRGHVALKGELTQARMVFGYAADDGILLPYRKELASPKRKDIRKARNEQGERMFSPEEIRSLIKAADPQLRAMIYLGVNCAFGPTDCGRITFDKIKDGWHTMARPKTESPRRCPLWPETIKAIKDYQKVRPEPKPGNESLVFLTRFGNSWARESGDNGISSELAKLLQQLDIHRLGNNFYSLRRTFETVASALGPQAAVDLIMGHTPDSQDMSAVYRQKVYDDNLRKVSEYVRKWLKGKVKLQ